MTTQLLMNIVARAKVSLRIMTSAFDGEISDLVSAAYDTLTTRGITITVIDNMVPPMILRAIITYVRMHFGEPSDYDRLKESWETQLGQLMTTTGYTTWSEEE